MRANFDRLYRFMEKYAKNQEILPYSMELVKPFLKIAENHHYPFRPLGELNYEKTASAVALATGNMVDKILPFSATPPFPMASHLEFKEYCEKVKNLPNKDLLLFTSPTVKLWDSPYESPRPKHEVNGLRGRLQESMFDNNIWDFECYNCNPFMRYSLNFTLRDSIFFFLDFVLAGGNNPCFPLIKLIVGGHPPVERKSFEQNTVVVLVE